jgi:hypothetical protein
MWPEIDKDGKSASAGLLESSWSAEKFTGEPHLPPRFIDCRDNESRLLAEVNVKSKAVRSVAMLVCSNGGWAW